LPGLRISSAGVPDDVDVTARLTLESILDGALTVTGRVTAPWAGECRRCLREVAGELVADVREVFEPRAIEGETYPLLGDRADLEPMLRDAVLLTLPLAPLCEDACAGPDPEEHPVSVQGDAPTEPDSRWAALRDLDL
jgi:uncharacterized protein